MHLAPRNGGHSSRWSWGREQQDQLPGALASAHASPQPPVRSPGPFPALTASLAALAVTSTSPSALPGPWVAEPTLTLCPPGSALRPTSTEPRPSQVSQLPQAPQVSAVQIPELRLVLDVAVGTGDGSQQKPTPPSLPHLPLTVTCMHTHAQTCLHADTSTGMHTHRHRDTPPPQVYAPACSHPHTGTRMHLMYTHVTSCARSHSQTHCLAFYFHTRPLLHMLKGVTLKHCGHSPAQHTGRHGHANLCAQTRPLRATTWSHLCCYTHTHTQTHVPPSPHPHTQAAIHSPPHPHLSAEQAEA